MSPRSLTIVMTAWTGLNISLVCLNYGTLFQITQARKEILLRASEATAMAQARTKDLMEWSTGPLREKDFKDVYAETPKESPCTYRKWAGQYGSDRAKEVGEAEVIKSAVVGFAEDDDGSTLFIVGDRELRGNQVILEASAGVKSVRLFVEDTTVGVQMSAPIKAQQRKIDPSAEPEYVPAGWIPVTPYGINYASPDRGRTIMISCDEPSMEVGAVVISNETKNLYVLWRMETR